MTASYSAFVVLTAFGIAFAEDPCDFQHWVCEGDKAKFKPIVSGDLANCRSPSLTKITT